MKDAVPAKTILCEYLGEVITSDDCKRRITGYEKNEDFYFAGLGEGLVLDAKNCGSVARFANHSCNPSCELQKWTVLGEIRIVLVSKRKLFLDDEITYNYNYFDDGLENEMRMKRQPCKCASPNCCGTIGGRVEPVVDLADEWVNRGTAFLAKLKKYPFEQVVEHIGALDRIPLAERARDERIEPTLAKLKDVVDAVLQWKTIACSVFSVDQMCSIMFASKPEVGSRGRLVSIDAAAQLLDQVPYNDCIKIDEAVVIADRLQLALRGMKNIQTLRKASNGGEAITRPIKLNANLTEGSRGISNSSSIQAEKAVRTDDDDDIIPDTDPEEGTSESVSDVASNSSSSGSGGGGGGGGGGQSKQKLSETGSNIERARQNLQRYSWGHSGNLHWEDVVLMIKSLAAALPIYVPGAEYIAKLYDENVEWGRQCMISCGFKLSPPDFVSAQQIGKGGWASKQNAFSDDIVEAVTAFELLRSAVRKYEAYHYTLEQYTTVEDAIVMNGTTEQQSQSNTLCGAIAEPSTKRAQTEGVHAEALLSWCNFLEECVDFYLSRKALLTNSAASSSKSGSKRKRSTDASTAAAEDDNAMAMAVDKVNEIPSSKHVLLCYCRQREEYSEINSFIECDGCQRWFHPQCCNIGFSKAVSGPKGASYYCPTCLLLTNQVNQFALAPSNSAEWRYSTKHSMLRILTLLTQTAVPREPSKTTPSIQNDTVEGKVVIPSSNFRFKRPEHRKLFPFAPTESWQITQLQQFVTKEQSFQLNAVSSICYFHLDEVI
jgi:hypothetical protein